MIPQKAALCACIENVLIPRVEDYIPLQVLVWLLYVSFLDCNIDLKVKKTLQFFFVVVDQKEP